MGKRLIRTVHDTISISPVPAIGFASDSAGPTPAIESDLTDSVAGTGIIA